MNVKTLVIVAVTVIFIGCKSKSTYEKILPADENHIIRQKFKDNILISQIEYLNTGDKYIRDGYNKTYFDKGGINTIGYYKKNKKDGVFYRYNETGVLVEKLIFANDTLVGPQYKYYENGRIQEFGLILTGTEVRFNMQYDSSTGKLINVNGHPLFLKINDANGSGSSGEVEIDNIFARPDKMRTDLTVNVINNKNKITRDTTFTNYQYLEVYDLYFLTYKQSYAKGETYMAILKLYDSASNNLVVADTQTIKMQVK